MRIHISTIFIILIMQQSAEACPACAKAQPKIIRGLTHGVGPQNNLDWIIVAIISMITVITFFYALKYIFKPGEKDSKHIKKTILNL